MQIMSCLSCKRILHVPLDVKEIRCKDCKKELRKILTISITERRKLLEVYENAQKTLTYLTKFIEDVTALNPWRLEKSFTWPERLAYYLALLQTYAFRSYYSGGVKLQLPDLTRKAAIYYLRIVEHDICELIITHVDEIARDYFLEQYDPYDKMYVATSFESYMDNITMLLRNEFPELDYDFERAVNLHKDLIYFFLYRVFVQEEDEKITPFIEYVITDKKAALNSLVFKDIPGEEFDTSLIVLLERDRDMMHHAGSFFKEIFGTTALTSDWDEEYQLYRDFFEFLSEHALDIKIQDVFYFPQDKFFEEFFRMLKKKSRK